MQAGKKGMFFSFIKMLAGAAMLLASWYGFYGVPAGAEASRAILFFQSVAWGILAYAWAQAFLQRFAKAALDFLSGKGFYLVDDLDEDEDWDSDAYDRGA